MLIIAKILNEASSCYNKQAEENMYLIVGLGNPGKKYKFTPHNIGFLAVEKARKAFPSFSRFKLSKDSRALLAEGLIKNRKALLAKPQTYMNESGKAVKALVKERRIKPSRLIVIHDEADLPLGKLKISKNKGPAGHKGAASIIKELKTKNFIRIRLGVGSPEAKEKSLKDFVLREFTKEELVEAEEATKRAVLAIESIIAKGLEKAMTEFNKKEKLSRKEGG
jgi:PTH1 family peptidyl-tRNA hydrolase